MNLRKHDSRRSGIRILARVLFFVLLPALLSTPTPSASGAEKTKNVLLVFSYDPQLPGVVAVNQSIRETLSRGLSGRVQVYVEYIDEIRLSNERYRQQLLSFLRLKYANLKFDLIIPIDSPALRLAMEYRTTSFPETPIVFMLIDIRELQGLDVAPDVTGVTGRSALSSTLDLALKLHADTRQVVVVTGASRLDRMLEALAREEFRGYESRLKLTYLTGLKMNDLKSELARLPSNTVVFYISFHLDGEGQFYTSPEALSLIAQASSFPIYGCTDAYLGRGIVGGILLNFGALGVRAAELGLRVMAGEKPSKITVETVPGTPNFDYRQLRRWGISEQILPPGSIVRFKEPSFWDLYYRYVIGVISLIILQSLFIAALLVNRARRKQAQQSLDERLRFEATLAELSAAFVRSPADGVDREIGKWLERLFDFFDVDRISLVEYSPEGTMLGIAHSHSRLVGEVGSDLILLTQSSWYAEQLRRGEPLIFTRLPDDLPEQAQMEREYCLKTGLKSNLVIPLSVGGAKSCALALSSVHSYREWPVEVIARLRLIGEVFANALIRQQGEQTLHDAFAEIKDLKDQLEAENVYLQEEIKLSHNFEEIIGESDALKYVLYKVEQVAAADTTVLIQGETGTGKELIARAIHNASARKNRALVKVNCATLPANLIENELFGHEKGAFTGATARQIGRFELANGGTLFLDEIGELPLELQPKLLRVLQDGEFERLGSTKTLKVDVRIIAATNRDLKEEIRNRRFREDLWYRLSVFPLTLPALRHRKSDIPLLVNHYVNRFSKILGKQIQSIAPATIKALGEYDWPGNVRELANVIERAVINMQGPVLHLVDKLEPAPSSPQSSLNGDEGSWKSLAEMEREIILQRLEATGWKIEGPHGAAKSLGLKASTLRLRMHKLGIHRPEADK